MNSDVHKFAEESLASSPLNRVPASYGGGPIYGSPLTGVSAGDDPLFQRLKDVASPAHLTPAELWIGHGLPPVDHLRILTVVFPFAGHIHEAGVRNDADMPPEVYCVARNLANPLIESIMDALARHIAAEGFLAVVGGKSQQFGIFKENEPFRIHSNWSERHVAFVAGLGTFGLHRGLITEAGCNVRLSSVITNAPLTVTARPSDEPHGDCLHFTTGSCGKCIARCPIGAISQEGHDKQKCLQHGRKVSQEMQTRPLAALLKSHHRRINGTDRLSYPVGCALCQFGVPCMERSPARSETISAQPCHATDG